MYKKQREERHAEGSARWECRRLAAVESTAKQIEHPLNLLQWTRSPLALVATVRTVGASAVSVLSALSEVWVREAVSVWALWVL